MKSQFERRALLEELVSQGVRVTSQRRALVEVIQEASEHLDAASLLELARQREPNIDRATVYRTLELLRPHRRSFEPAIRATEGGDRAASGLYDPCHALGGGRKLARLRQRGCN